MTNNTAKNNGGAVCHEIALTVKDSSFINNSATTAGAIYRDATSNLYNNTFSGNTPRKFEPQNGTFTELYNLIKNATGELTLEHDYVFTPTFDYGLINGIYIYKQTTDNKR